MGLRISTILDESIEKKVRVIQAKLLRRSTKSVSFSYVLNRVVENGLKKFKA